MSRVPVLTINFSWPRICECRSTFKHSMNHCISANRLLAFVILCFQFIIPLSITSVILCILSISIVSKPAQQFTTKIIIKMCFVVVTCKHVWCMVWLYFGCTCIQNHFVNGTECKEHMHNIKNSPSFPFNVSRVFAESCCKLCCVYIPTHVRENNCSRRDWTF